MPDAPPPSTLVPPASPIGRAPLLWVAAPLLVGYLVAGACPAVSPRLLAGIALPCLLGAVALAVKGPAIEFRRWPWFKLWAGCFLSGVLLLGWAWHNVRVRPPPDWAGLPPREATLTLRVLQNFRQVPGSDYAGGLAKVAVAPPLLRDLENRTVYFRVRARGGELPPARGATVEVQGLLKFVEATEPGPTATPEEASSARFAAYLHAQGAWFEVVRGRTVREIAPPGAWMRWLAAQNERIDSLLRRGPAGLAKDFGDIYVSILLGDPSLLTSEQKSLFIVSGTVHLFAISGLQVCILAGALLWVWRRIPGLPRALGDIFTLAALWLYTEITGGSPSARRSALMFTFYLLGGWLQRKRSAFPAVLAAGVATLLADPLAPGNAGFVLSYAVVLGMILYALPLDEALRARFAPWRDVPPASLAPWQKTTLWFWKNVLAMFLVSWTALLCSAPLTTAYFGVFSANGLFLNLLLVPLSCLVLWMGAVAVGLGIWGLPPFTWLAWVANALGLCGAGLMVRVAGWTLPIPGMFLRLRVEPHWAGPAAALVILATLLLGRSRLRAPRWWFYLLPVGILLIFAVCAVRPE